MSQTIYIQHLVSRNSIKHYKVHIQHLKSANAMTLQGNHTVPKKCFCMEVPVTQIWFTPHFTAYSGSFFTFLFAIQKNPKSNPVKRHGMYKCV